VHRRFPPVFMPPTPQTFKMAYVPSQVLLLNPWLRKKWAKAKSHQIGSGGLWLVGKLVMRPAGPG
jgi:hypothetical protein